MAFVIPRLDRGIQKTSQHTGSRGQAAGRQASLREKIRQM